MGAKICSDGHAGGEDRGSRALSDVDLCISPRNMYSRFRSAFGGQAFCVFFVFGLGRFSVDVE